MKYRKKPVVIEAVQFDGNNHQEVFDFAVGAVATYDENGITILTAEGGMLALPGDYVIKGVQNEFYPRKPDIFEATYEKV